MKNIKRIALFILMFITLNICNATDYKSKLSGIWIDTIWNNSGYPDDVSDNVILDKNDEIELPNNDINITIGKLYFSNNSKLTIPENDTLICDSISILNNADLIVDGVLIVTGGVHMNNNSFLNIQLNGVVEVLGDFYGANNADLTVSGTLIIDGIFDWNGNEIQGGGIIINGSVPIELLSFELKSNINNIEINWTTASELNNEYFIIQKSINGFDFYDISLINGAGTSNNIHNYTFYDENPNNGLNYYRLKQIDFDGKYEIFDIKSIYFKIENLKIISNNKSINIITNDIQYNVLIYDIDGILKYKNILSGNNTINLNKGIYILVINNNTYKINIL